MMRFLPATMMLLVACAETPTKLLPGQAVNGGYGPTLDEEFYRIPIGSSAHGGTTALCGLALAAAGEMDRAWEAARFCLSRRDVTMTAHCLTTLLLIQLYGEIETSEIRSVLWLAVTLIEVAPLRGGGWALHAGETTPNPAATALALTALRQARRVGYPVKQPVLDLGARFVQGTMQKDGRTLIAPWGRSHPDHQTAFGALALASAGAIHDAPFRYLDGARSMFLEAPLTLEHLAALLAAKEWFDAPAERLRNGLLKRARRQTAEDRVLGSYGEAVRTLILLSEHATMPLYPRIDLTEPSKARLLYVARRPTWRFRHLAAFLERAYDARVILADDPPHVSAESTDLVIIDGHDPAPWRTAGWAVIDAATEPSAWSARHWNRRIAEALDAHPTSRTWLLPSAEAVLFGATVGIEAHLPDATDSAVEVSVEGPEGARFTVSLHRSRKVKSRYTGSIIPARVGVYRLVHKSVEEPAIFRVDPR